VGQCSISPVRARLKWILGALGLAGLVAYLRRRRAPAQAEHDPRAAELRRTLEESREAADRAAPTEPEKEPTEDLAERRRGVHERGHSALDEMTPPPAE